MNNLGLRHNSIVSCFNSQMYEEHPNISTPPDDTVIWRYMNLEKLLALLCDKSLFMCRLDKLRDPWEGDWPTPALALMRSILADQAEEFIDFSEKMKAAFYVNCWHAGKHQSAALWDSYAGRAGLAIKSTSGRLKSAIDFEKPFYIGQVSYCDYSQANVTGSINLLSPPFLKRKSFEHEREVRVLIWNLPFDEEEDEPKVDWSKAQASISVPVDLATLIDAVYLSPMAPNWLLPYVRKLVSKFDLPDIHVENSGLYSK